MDSFTTGSVHSLRVIIRLHLLREGRFAKLEVEAGLATASSSFTSSTGVAAAAAAVGAAVLRDRPPYPPLEGLEKRFLGLLFSVVVGASEVEGRFWERNLKRLRP